jgi:L-galactose dehydrogenase
MSESSLPTRRLGRTGKRVPLLGLGGAALNRNLYGKAHSEAESIATVHRALELGVTYIDTSAGYGDSEERIGRALEGGRREQVFLATKTGTGTNPKDYSGDGTRRSIERSLKRLRTDYLDLVIIHDPEDLSPTLADGGALDVLLELKAQKVIGAIGLGVREHHFLRQAITHGAFDVILTYADFNLVRQTARENLFPLAEAHDVGIVLGSPLMYGWLSNRSWETLIQEHSGRDEDRSRAKAIRDWAAAQNLDIVSLALQYVLRDTRIATVLTGAGSPEEIEENVRAATAEPFNKVIWESLERDLGIA